jgi:diguanylate cyclase (GGDEF)-like protein
VLTRTPGAGPLETGEEELRSLDLLRRPPARLGPLVRDGARWGELTLARVRLAAGLVFIGVAAVTTAAQTTVVITICLAAAFIATGIVVELCVRGGIGERSVGFLSTAFDISVVTAGLVVAIAMDDSFSPSNERNMYACYLAVLASTALRYDARICLFATLLTGVEYGIVTASFLTIEAPIAGVTGDMAFHGQLVRFSLIAIVGAIATANVLRFQRVLALSTHDSLTGLLNRRSFERALEERLWLAERERGEAFAVAMCDIDHFKQLNDRYGHEAGDCALRAVASAIRRSVRTTDLVARYGGEEFAVLLTAIDARMACLRLDEVRKQVAGTPLLCADRRTGQHVTRATISAGVALWPSDARGGAELVAAADERLYAAKNAGRDRVVGPRGITWSSGGGRRGNAQELGAAAREQPARAAPDAPLGTHEAALGDGT